MNALGGVTPSPVPCCRTPSLAHMVDRPHPRGLTRVAAPLPPLQTHVVRRRDASPWLLVLVWAWMKAGVCVKHTHLPKRQLPVHLSPPPPPRAGATSGIVWAPRSDRSTIPKRPSGLISEKLMVARMARTRNDAVCTRASRQHRITAAPGTWL